MMGRAANLVLALDPTRARFNSPTIVSTLVGKGPSSESGPKAYLLVGATSLSRAGYSPRHLLKRKYSFSLVLFGHATKIHSFVVSLSLRGSPNWMVSQEKSGDHRGGFL